MDEIWQKILKVRPGALDVCRVTSARFDLRRCGNLKIYSKLDDPAN